MADWDSDMADSEDLKLLDSGELDLNRCDFREADLSNRNLAGRNFTNCRLEKAIFDGTNFGGSNFRNSQVSFMSAKGADFSNCDLSGLHLGFVNLQNSSLRNASVLKSYISHTDLTDSDLRGTDFSGGTLDVDTILSGAIYDNDTTFEGLKVLRATSRNKIFDQYDYRDGILRKRPETATGEASASTNASTVSGSGGSVPHSDGTFFSDGSGYAAPASDRTVSFDHNDPEYSQIAENLSGLIREIRFSNEELEGKEPALRALDYASDLWSRTTLPLMLLRVGFIMALEDAMTLLGKASFIAALEVIKASAVDHIRKNFGL